MKHSHSTFRQIGTRTKIQCNGKRVSSRNAQSTEPQQRSITTNIDMRVYIRPIIRLLRANALRCEVSCIVHVWSTCTPRPLCRVKLQDRFSEEANVRAAVERTLRIRIKLDAEISSHAFTGRIRNAHSLQNECTTRKNTWTYHGQMHLIIMRTDLTVITRSAWRATAHSANCRQQIQQEGKGWMKQDVPLIVLQA
jgi:hypothetical protein